MDTNWIKIFSSDKIHIVRLYIARLAEEEIEAVEMVKKDSSYSMFGEIELYVNSKDVVKAKHILENQNLE